MSSVIAYRSLSDSLSYSLHGHYQTLSYNLVTIDLSSVITYTVTLSDMSSVITYTVTIGPSVITDTVTIDPQL